MGMKKLFLLALLFIAILLSACATIFLGTKQKIRFDSEPRGARVIINGVDSGESTPCKIKIPRDQPKGENKRRQVNYEFRKNNYAPVIIHDVSQKSVFLAVISWYPFILPGIIDVATGANNRYASSHFVRLEPVKSDTVVKREIVYVDKEPVKEGYVFTKDSDIDRDIPKGASPNPRRFALIIGNEDYSTHQVGLSSEVDVQFARNDASAFREYAINVLGVPERNIMFLLDATTGQMRQAMSKISALIRSTYGEANVFVYYAGHGLPDESTRESYLMPVDVSGKNANDGIKLSELYDCLTEYPSERITLFVDACFSGGARSQPLVAARGVRIKPRPSPIKGNMVVFAASSSDQTALPYADQKHGFFTYHLLKLLKEKGPKVTYSQIAEYMQKYVEVESILVNDKEQTPQVNASPSLGNEWLEWNFK
jgi:hypothetical protein